MAVIMVGLVAAGYVWSSPETLSPPAGKILGTSPSLAEIDAKLEEVVASVTNVSISLNGDAREVFYQELVGSQLNSIVVHEGPVLVHSICIFAGDIVAFDGPGSISNSGLVQSGTPIGRATVQYEDIYDTGTGKASIGRSTASADMGVIAHDGLQVSWSREAGNSFIAVYYTPLTK